jgi:dCMP deaminase
MPVRFELYTWDKRFLLLADHVSKWSKDPSTKVGAVIVDPDKRVVSMGYNGFPAKIEDLPEHYEDRDTKLKKVVHAESNAIIFSQRSLKDCTIYLYPFMPCSNCAGQIIQSGISRVVAPINSNPKWQESFKLTQAMFEEADIVLDLYGMELLYV